MIYGIYSMRDKLDGYMGLKLEGNDNVAIRNFSILVNDPSLSVSYNPDDFDLYKVGTFDSDSGELCPCVPSFISSGSNCVSIRSSRSEDVRGDKDA